MSPPENSKPSTSASGPVTPELSSEEKVAAAFAAINAALKGLSNRESLDALRAVGGMRNLVVTPVGAVAQRAAAATPKGSQPESRGSKPNPKNKDPKVLKLKARLAELKKQVRAEADAHGLDVLPDDHNLVVEKRRVEEDLKSFRAAGSVEASSETSSESKGKGKSA